MHDDRALVEDRIDRVLRERLWPAVHPDSVPLTVATWDVPGEPVTPAEGLGAEYHPARIGQPWGRPWGTTWLRVQGRVPEHWAGRTVEAIVDLGFNTANPGFQAEGLVYRPDGSVVKGLNPHNSAVPVGSPVHGGEEVVFHVEAAANPVILDDAHRFAPTDLGDPETSGVTPLYRLQRADLSVFDREVWELAHDLEAIQQLMHELGIDNPRRWELLRACERALDRIDLQDIGCTARAGRAALSDVLASPAAASAHQVSAVGHAHIDSAWLWPVRETIRKVARTVSNVAALMDDHSDFVFAMSQAQQWAWIQQHRPEVFRRAVEKVKTGQFVPVGGMWVESDTNLPGGEALARQFVHGKRYFLEELGIETEEVWLPDSFGYSGALPQLIALSGARWFLTQKLSWSQTNKFPHHTFWWEGIDGTRVFTHFPPVDTYNAVLSGGELAHASRTFAEKGSARRSLVPYGLGDGGGGPTREMLARARRFADLEGSPQVRLESPATFFHAAEQEYPDAPVWVGELYLEYHRGTYTSQAKTKQGNRRCEHLLREAELWAATAAVRVGAEYPSETLDRLWKSVLLNQFHDILPGTSIAWVHREAERTYAQVAEELSKIISATQSALAGNGRRTIVFNAAPYEDAGVPAMGAVEASTQSTVDIAVTRRDGHVVVDNGLLAISIDDRGLLTSIHDHLADREVVAPGLAANLLQVHADLPNAWDAWDIDAFYRNTVTDLTDVDEVGIHDHTAQQVAVRVRRSFSRSTVTQLIVLRAGSRRVDIETEVDWHETEKLLKVAFPVDLHTDRATAETQFAHVHRSTHTNTSWDAAKFEICAHRWLRVGEPDYGVALVNDSSYGHDVTRSVRAGGGTTTTVRGSLLRAPRFPDPTTDHGVHRFRHALVAGATLIDAVREGYLINLPARSVTGSHTVEPLVVMDNPGIVIESVKLADDGSGDVVVRLYEATGNRADCLLSPGFPTAGWSRTDLLERPTCTEQPTPDGGIRLRLRPFQILTVRLRRG